jgi:hypothetical protein
MVNKGEGEERIKMREKEKWRGYERRRLEENEREK